MYKYGRQEDLRRLLNCLSQEGQYLCKLNKMPNGKLVSLDEAEICDINPIYYSTITSRYYKGIGSHKDNMIMEIQKIPNSQAEVLMCKKS